MKILSCSLEFCSQMYLNLQLNFGRIWFKMSKEGIMVLYWVLNSKFRWTWEKDFLRNRKAILDSFLNKRSLPNTVKLLATVIFVTSIWLINSKSCLYRFFSVFSHYQSAVNDHKFLMFPFSKTIIFTHV